MVASGRTCSRKTTAVNFPDIIENSYSQQEETKPNFRDSKYRLLMSQVAYLRNYQLKTYEDRKDHDEEQIYRDSRNKLLMSQVAYYLGCRLKTEENDQDEDEDVHVAEAEQIQESRAPRNLQESVEEEAPQESWDEGYSTLSVPPGTSAFSEPYRSNLHSLEEQQVDLARDIDKIKNDQEEEEDQGPPCPRLSMELVEAEEPEVFRYSLDILYSTYTAYPEFYYTCQDYTYAIFLLVEGHVRLTLDMDSRFLTMTVIGLHLVSRIGVIFQH
ncbi:neuroblastoma breakpoint family member 3-like isoform X3 [Cebus imitator]|uniref:neuroblastoma breakpoint family member 3-like isoform X3 n=1 Tax=Cebus imitator TaxID=2715852 RepID=UPI000809F244|nr:neuroblastoma breakpoint family member 3-like isoform X3 [Cebus imitator]